MPARAVRAWPYRRVKEQTVVAGPWTLDPGTESEGGLPEYITGWDYNRNLHLVREIRVDLPAARRDTGLDASVQLAVSVSWRVLPSNLRGSAGWVPVTDGGASLKVDVVLPGERLGGVLHVETMLVLAEDGPRRPFVASRPGSKLWEDEVEVRLQGDAPLFPIAEVPFSASALPDGAGWFLEIGTDLHASAMGSIQLLINGENPDVVAAFNRAGAPNEVDRVILSAARTDAVRTMVDRALGSDEFSLDLTFEENSLGAVLQGLIRTFFGVFAEDPALIELRRIRESDAPLFAAYVQAATRFLGRP